METNNEMNKEAKAFVKNFIEKFNISTEGDFDKINLELHQVLKNEIATEKEMFFSADIISKYWEIKNSPIFILVKCIVNLLLIILFVIFFIKTMSLNDNSLTPIFISVNLMFITIILMKINAKFNDKFYEYKRKKFLDKLVESNPSLVGYKAHLQEQKSKKLEFLIRAYKEMEENKK
ncbi:hypothetical protein [Riemerella anatipestifer]|uniref:hypothetical protein n=1 Tax=Riemerella anatipestifer TaxID=34085 RepID=UPI00129EA285|nr:hypothetical protein [Riemerella anatipestifer]MRM84334.1 hypothetical protein [Riemerella anatipestifer]